MLTEEEIRKKLYHQAAMFRHYCQNKDWPIAKYIYDRARAVSTFVELDEKDQIKLFGSRAYNDTNPPTDGEFREKGVERAYLECIKKNQTYESKAYSGPTKKE